MVEEDLSPECSAAAAVDADPHRQRTRRAMLVVLTLGATLLAALVFASLMLGDGLHLLDPLLIFLFAVLFGWVCLSFLSTTLGLLVLWRRPQKVAVLLNRVTGPETSAARAVSDASLPMTAILMPVYNEEPSRVFAGIHAMHQSLQETGLADRFAFFVLSDTTDPDVWLEEEAQWARLTDRLAGGGGAAVFYRRRPRNVARKSGNIEEFCKRWGSGYSHMIVLDADSVMDGFTLLEMVRRMEQDSQIGILQVPPTPVGNDSLFARVQQFAASVYGPVFTAGFESWAHHDSNYWGHNAIIRVEPFMRHCGLPKLPGRAPLGGEILSHDFVEAALMRRAGYKVVLARDLSGSYEEAPTTLIDYAKRDRRWCQGNMQHLQLIFASDLHPVSRVHLAMGVMSYLTSPLWLMLMVLGLVEAARRATQPEFAGFLRQPSWLDGIASTGVQFGVLFAVTMGMLLVPKLWSYLLLLRDRKRLRRHGGAVAVAASMLLETGITSLTAPIMMAFHSTFVLTTFLGRAVMWSAQRRGAVRTAGAELFRTHLPHLLAGLITLGLTAWLVPGLLPWLSPVIGGLILSLPLSALLSSTLLGMWTRAFGLLLIGEEVKTPAVLRWHHQLAADAQAEVTARGGLDRFTQVILDPAFNALHIAVLRSNGANPVVPAALAVEQQFALNRGPRYLSKEAKLALLSDELSMRWLHETAWQRWPPETLALVGSK